MRVALVHDWLTGMRGGEKCLEVFCELFPSADLYTLVYAPEKVSATIRHMTVKTSFISQLPWAKRAYRYYLPLFPAAIERFELGPHDLVLSTSHCVAKGIFPPSRFAHRLCACAHALCVGSARQLFWRGLRLDVADWNGSLSELSSAMGCPFGQWRRLFYCEFKKCRR